MEYIFQYFQDQVQLLFAELCTDFGLECKQTTENTYLFQSDKCCISFSIHKGHLPQLSLTIHPIKKGYKEYGLGTILDAFHDPEASFNTREISDTGDLDKDLTNAKEMLLKFCVPIIRGDFSIWLEVQKQVDVAISKWKYQRSKKGESSKKWQLHEFAVAEFGRRNYAEAIALWEQVKDELDSDELSKYNFAQSKKSNPA